MATNASLRAENSRLRALVLELGEQNESSTRVIDVLRSALRNLENELRACKHQKSRLGGLLIESSRLAAQTAKHSHDVLMSFGES
jgi:hypothetical protein